MSLLCQIMGYNGINENMFPSYTQAIVSCMKHTETHIPHINITYSHRKFTTVTTPERNNWKRESERMRGSESNRLL